MSEEEKKFDLQNFDFEKFYGPACERELKVWTGDEASYYEREKEMCVLYTDKFDETSAYVKELWDKADSSKDGQINEAEWYVLLGSFDDWTKQKFNGNFINWSEAERK